MPIPAVQVGGNVYWCEICKFHLTMISNTPNTREGGVGRSTCLSVCLHISLPHIGLTLAPEHHPHENGSIWNIQSDNNQIQQANSQEI